MSERIIWSGYDAAIDKVADVSAAVVLDREAEEQYFESDEAIAGAVIAGAALIVDTETTLRRIARDLSPDSRVGE